MTTERPPSSHDAETTPVLARPTASSAEAVSKMLKPDPVPEKIGEYRILRELGKGGMGMVYLAKRELPSFTQTVALKIIKKGMDSEEILKRFDLERQLLSGLNHANIARLIDGGTTPDGRPYFALEYVDGLPIDKYCDSNRLTTRARLDLFRKVCAAVQYAHQNLIVHRDLKPGNIMVTAQGEPKLLDFGIAKLLNPTIYNALAVTGPSVRLMTPEYASPEQVRGDPITTSSDIYSLGVILYELLTGRRPYKFKTRLQQEIMRIVCDEPPEKPSTAISKSDEQPEAEGRTTRIEPATIAETREGDVERLRRKLRGDIDDIVMKALEKSPQRRYVSADQLAEDIERHIKGEPIIARPPSMVYRASKFVQRNRWPVGAAAGIAVALTAGLAGTATQWARAEQQKDAAVEAREKEEQQRAAAEAAREQEEKQRREAEDAKALAERSYNDTWDVLQSYIGEVHAAVAALPEAVKAREVIVNTAADKMKGLADNWKDDPNKQLIVSGAYERLGQLAADIRGGSKGNITSALEHHQRALEMREKVLATKPESVTYQRAVASSHLRVADVQKMKGDLAGSEASYEKAREMLERQDGDDKERRLTRTMLAAVLGQLGDFRRDRGDLAGATAMYERSIALRRSLRDAYMADAQAPGLDDKQSQALRTQSMQARRNVTVGQFDLARILLEAGRRDEAMAMYDEALAERRALLEMEPKQARTKRDLSVALILTSEARSNLGRHADAVRESGEAVELIAALTAIEAANPEARNVQTLGNARAAHAAALFASAESSADPKGTLDASLRSWLAAVDLFVERVNADSNNHDNVGFLADARAGAAETLLRLGRAADALEQAKQSADLTRESLLRTPDDLSARRGAVRVLRLLAEAHAARSEDAGLDGAARSASQQSARAAFQEAITLATQADAGGLKPRNEADSTAALQAALQALDGKQNP